MISLLRKDIHKRIGKLLYHQKYTADEIVETMCNLGMKKGSVICIHASMKEFYNYQGTAEELIKKIQTIITTEGTLIMPSYPTHVTKKNQVISSTQRPIQHLQVTLQKFLGRVQMLFVALMYNTQFVHGENMRNGS